MPLSLLSFRVVINCQRFKFESNVTEKEIQTIDKFASSLPSYPPVSPTFPYFRFAETNLKVRIGWSRLETRGDSRFGCLSLYDRKRHPLETTRLGQSDKSNENTKRWIYFKIMPRRLFHGYKAAAEIRRGYS